MTKSWTIPVGDASVSAIYEPAEGEEIGVFVCAHGAGGNMHDRSVSATAKAMRAHGIGVVRFNFLYTEKKTSRPDAMPKLLDVWRAVVAHVRTALGSSRLVIGGRSMGGRAASMLAAEGFEADGLLLLAYPLHPAGQPAKLRDAHLKDIRMPVICFNGTRDPLCTPALMEKALGTVVAPWGMRWVETADHSFHVLKSSGKTDAQVMDEMGAAAADWMRGLEGQ